MEWLRLVKMANHYPRSVQEVYLENLLYYLIVLGVSIKGGCYLITHVSRRNSVFISNNTNNRHQVLSHLALTKCRLWAIDRQSFQQIMMKTGLERHEKHVQFLKRYRL